MTASAESKGTEESQMKKGAWVVLAGLVLALVAVMTWGPPDDKSAQSPPATTALPAKPSAGLPTAPAPGAATAAQPAPAPATPTRAAQPVVPPPEEPRGSDRIRPLPRKKAVSFDLDLDGDGTREHIAVEQKQPADNWAGQGTPGGPEGKVQVRRGAQGEVALQWNAQGYALGVFGLPVRVGGGREVALYAQAGIDTNEQEIRWIGADPGGAVKQGPLQRVPLELWDLLGDGRDAVSVMSQELYHDFIKRGTMDLLTWREGRFESLLPRPVFELCALETGPEQPLWVVAVTRKADALLLLTWTAGEARLKELQRIAVTPPDKGPPWHVSHGFALACSFPGDPQNTVQYRDRHFKLGPNGQLSEIPPPPAP